VFDDSNDELVGNQGAGLDTPDSSDGLMAPHKPGGSQQVSGGVGLVFGCALDKFGMKFDMRCEVGMRFVTRYGMRYDVWYEV
jgi:hypothetical protein